MTHLHETWMDTFADEPDEPSIKQSDDEERRVEDYLDTARGVWGPTE
jgi:hypothetical protein